MGSQTATDETHAAARPRFRLHWHVILTHFPVSGFTGAFLFMALHVITRESCMATASYLTLVAATIVLAPTTFTGWIEWRKTYRSFMNKVFRNKIRVAAGMLPLAIALVVLQTLWPLQSLDASSTLPHALYFGGLALLMLAAMAEGYWGGRLHHR